VGLKDLGMYVVEADLSTHGLRGNLTQEDSDCFEEISIRSRYEKLAQI
jgi:hypothetical protein